MSTKLFANSAILAAALIAASAPAVPAQAASKPAATQQAAAQSMPAKANAMPAKTEATPAMPPATRMKSTAVQPKAEAAQADKLLRDVGREAVAVSAHALRLQALSRESSTTWQDYDRQWNEMMPKVEEMDRQVARLEAIRPSTLPWQQEAIDRGLSLSGKVGADTDQLRSYMNEHPNELSSAPLRQRERDVELAANELAQAVHDASTAAKTASKQTAGMKKAS